MQILFAPPAASGVSSLVAVSGDTYLYPRSTLAGLLPDGANTLDFLLWAVVGLGLGHYVMGEKRPKRLMMYAAGGAAVRLIL
jgi:hypothetical protein